MHIKHVIGWNMDTTLGVFDELHCRFSGASTDEDTPPLALKPGIKAALERLSARDITHVLTSAAKKDLSTRILGAVTLLDLFEWIKHTPYDMKLEGKPYEPVAKHFGYAPAEAIKHMIVYGSCYIDRPVDIDGLVFINEQRRTYLDSCVAEAIIDRLLTCNENFNDAFKDLYQTSHTVQHRKTWGTAMQYYEEMLTSLKEDCFPFVECPSVNLGDGIEFLMYYDRIQRGGLIDITIPTIVEIQAPNYVRDLEIIEL